MKKNPKPDLKNSDTKYYSISMLLPSLVIILSICLGLSAIRFALLGKWEVAVAFLVIAAFIDALDSSIERIFHLDNALNEQLRLISMVTNFTISPAIILFLWKVHEMQGVGWALCMLYIVCLCVKIAKHSTIFAFDHSNKLPDIFHVGIPVQIAALLSIIPMVISFLANDNQLNHIIFKPAFSGLYMAVLAILTVSRVPTFSLRSINIGHPELITPLLIFMTLLTITVIVEPWIALSGIGIIYLLSIPVSILLFIKLRYF